MSVELNELGENLRLFPLNEEEEVDPSTVFLTLALYS